MGQRMCRVATAGSWVERQARCPGIACVPQDVLPCSIVGSADRFRANARRMVEKLLDRDPGLASIAQRLGPGDELEGGVIEGHPPPCVTFLALLRRDGEDRGADGLRAGGDPADVGHGTLAAFLLQDKISSPDDNGREPALIRFAQPLAKFASLSGSMPATRRMESGSPSIRQPPSDSGGGKYSRTFEAGPAPDSARDGSTGPIPRTAATRQVRNKSLVSDARFDMDAAFPWFETTR